MQCLSLEGSTPQSPSKKAITRPVSPFILTDVSKVANVTKCLYLLPIAASRWLQNVDVFHEKPVVVRLLEFGCEIIDVEASAKQPYTRSIRHDSTNPTQNLFSTNAAQPYSTNSTQSDSINLTQLNRAPLDSVLLTQLVDKEL